MDYKCIIFDCDGVLVDSEAISNAVLIDMIRLLGASISKEDADEHFPGRSLNSILELCESLIQGRLPEVFESEFRRRTFSLFKTELKPIKGIHKLLSKLIVPFCVASSGPMQKIRLNLTTTNLIDKFEHKMFSSYEIGSWKPNPDIFQYAADQMGVAPDDCVVVEDSLAGIQAAGFDVYGFANEKNQNALKAAGAKIFFEMDKLEELIINLIPIIIKVLRYSLRHYMRPSHQYLDFIGIFYLLKDY